MSEPRTIHIQIGKIIFDENVKNEINPNRVAYYIYVNGYLRTIIKQRHGGEYISVKIDIDKN